MELGAPTGFDEHSCAMRDKDGAFIQGSRRRPYGEAFGPGDVVGVLVCLPPEPPEAQRPKPILHSKTFRSRPAKDQPSVQYEVRYFEEIPYTMEGSSVSYFKNGHSFGPVWQNFSSGRYFPAVALFKGARVRANFGPDFSFPPSGVECRPVSDRSIFPPNPAKSVPGMQKLPEQACDSQAQEKCDAMLKPLEEQLQHEMSAAALDPLQGRPHHEDCPAAYATLSEESPGTMMNLAVEPEPSSTNSVPLITRASDEEQEAREGGEEYGL